MLETIARLSRQYGADPRFVFAGGGNTSCKDEEFLYVKPSGVALATIQGGDFVKLERAAVRRCFEIDPAKLSANEREAAIKRLLGAAVLSGGSIGTHNQMGIGDGLIPAILNTEIYDDICIITDEEAISTSKALASKEGIMCGISSGTNVAAAIKLAKKLGEGKTVVTVLPDTAERYFSTPLFE